MWKLEGSARLAAGDGGEALLPPQGPGAGGAEAAAGLLRPGARHTALRGED